MKQNLLLCFFLLLFLLSGCQKPIENTKSSILPLDREYRIEIKAGDFEGSAKIFFDEEGKFHLIHSDPNSPLFGMEEIISEEKTEFHFGKLSREEATRCEGTALSFFAMQLLSEKEPEKRESGFLEEAEVEIRTYSESDRIAKFFLSKSDGSPQKILGSGALSGLEIRFANEEQN